MEEVVYFYSGMEPIIRIIVVGTLAYLALIMLLRVSGKRTLAQMSAFDFIVTVAIGATFGRVLTAKSLSLSEGVTAFVTLAGLQYAVSSFRVRSSRFADLVSSDPSLLYFRGRFLRQAMKAERLTEGELLAAVRKQGMGSLHDVDAIVLEADGTIAIIRKGGDDLALEDIAEQRSGRSRRQQR